MAIKQVRRRRFERARAEGTFFLRLLRTIQCLEECEQESEDTAGCRRLGRRRAALGETTIVAVICSLRIWE